MNDDLEATLVDVLWSLEAAQYNFNHGRGLMAQMHVNNAYQALSDQVDSEEVSGR